MYKLYLCKMTIQSVIVAILFLGAVFYLIRTILRSLKHKKACNTNCSCGIDFSKMEIELDKSKES